MFNKKQLPHLSARVRFSSSVSCLATSSATSRGGCGTKGAGPSSERALSVVSRRRALGWERLSVTRESTSGERDGRDLRRETNAGTQDFWTRVKGRDSRIKKGQHLVVPRPSPVRVTRINALARKIALQRTCKCALRNEAYYMYMYMMYMEFPATCTSSRSSVTYEGTLHVP